MCVVRNEMMTFTRSRGRINVDRGIGKVRQMVQELMADFSWPGHFAIVMLGTPTRGTSLTVIWNNRYNIWNASRFQRASGPVVFTE